MQIITQKKDKMKKFITFLLMAVFLSSTGLVNVEAKTRKAKNTRFG